MFRYYHYRRHRNRKNSKNSDGADLLFDIIKTIFLGLGLLIMYGNRRERRFGKITLGTIIATFLLLGLGVPIPPAVCLFTIAGANIAGGVQANKRMGENNGSSRTRIRREKDSSSKSKSTNNENTNLKSSETKIHNKKNIDNQIVNSKIINNKKIKTENNMSIKDSDIVNTQKLHKENINTQKLHKENINTKNVLHEYEIEPSMDNIREKTPYNVEYYDSVKDAMEYQEVPDEYKKILIERINDENIIECPGLIWKDTDKLYIYPLIKDSKVYNISISDMDYIKFQKRFNPDIDEEFGDVGRYKIIEEFEDLLPMYPFGSDGVYTWKFIIENKFEITNTSGKAVFDIIGDDNGMIKNQAEEFRRMDLL